MNKLKEKTIRLTTKLLASEDNKNTYAYSKELMGMTGKRGIFILMYPTRDEDNFYVEDNTNMNILNHMLELEMTSYVVVNLFSKVTKSRLSTRGLTVDEENMKFIEEEILSKRDVTNTVVVVAWGNSNPTSRAVNQSKQRILEYWLEKFPNEPLYQLTCDGIDPGSCGIHPLFMGIRYSNAVWKVTPYPAKKILKELQKAEEEKIANDNAKQDSKKNKDSNKEKDNEPAEDSESVAEDSKEEDSESVAEDSKEEDSESVAEDNAADSKAVKGKPKRGKKVS